MAIRRQFPAIRSQFRQFIGHVERRKPRNSAIRLPGSLPFKILKREMERPGAYFLECDTTIKDGADLFVLEFYRVMFLVLYNSAVFLFLEFYTGYSWG